MHKRSIYSTCTSGLSSIFYPEYCCACGATLFQFEVSICLTCRNTLPETNYHLEIENPASKLFYGKEDVYIAASLYFFNKSSKVQELVHRIKYKGERKAAEIAGNWYGESLKDSPYFSDSDLLIPIPLHANKLITRGYNQAELFANGIATVMQKEVDSVTLVRKKFTETQTKKAMFERYLNVDDVFEFIETDRKLNHITIVDDVLTTGSTIAAAIKAIRKSTNSVPKISVVTLAFAKH